MKQIALRPPAGLFAAVEVEDSNGEIVGAAGPCFEEDRGTFEKSPLPVVSCWVKPHHGSLTLRWVYEDSSLGVVEQPYHGSGKGRW